MQQSFSMSGFRRSAARMRDMLLDSRGIDNHRDHAYVVLGFGMGVFLPPVALFHLVWGNPLISIALVTITGLLAWNSVSIVRGRGQKVPFSLLYGLVVSSIGASLIFVGGKAIYWCFPMTLIVFFIADRNQARWALLFGIVAFVPASFVLLPFDWATRFAGTYLITCFFGDRVVEKIDTLQAELAEQALIDPLTGANNRRKLGKALNEAVEAHHRSIGEFSLLAIDIDRFKRVNDQHGHGIGDQVLLKLAQLLQARIRSVDMLFRTGGEEFLVLMQDPHHGHPKVLAEDLRESVATANLPEIDALTVSIGVATLQPGESAKEWLNRADRSLYEAKAAGRNRVVIDTAG